MSRMLTYLLCSALFIIPAYAQEVRAFASGNDLEPMLRSWDRIQSGIFWPNPNELAVSAAEARGYVTSIADGLLSIPLLCGDFTQDQAMAVVVKYFEENPEEWSQPAYRLVQTALTSAFPCSSR